MEKHGMQGTGHMVSEDAVQTIHWWFRMQQLTQFGARTAVLTCSIDSCAVAKTRIDKLRLLSSMEWHRVKREQFTRIQARATTTDAIDISMLLGNLPTQDSIPELDEEQDTSVQPILKRELDDDSYPDNNGHGLVKLQRNSGSVS
jgi:hypothetical protein